MKLLGIDFGLRKIGLAVSEGFLAQPLGVIDIRNWELGISRICQGEGIEKIVVGLPGGKIDTQVKAFGAKVSELIKLPVEFQDETLTTQEAVAKMREIGRKVKDEDAISAALILQAYLDRV